jgi:hypothetical protein
MSDAYHVVAAVVRYKLGGDHDLAREAFDRASDLTWAEILSAAAALSAVRFGTACRVIGASPKDLCERTWQHLKENDAAAQRVRGWVLALSATRALIEHDLERFLELMNNAVVPPAVQFGAFVDILIDLMSSIGRTNHMDPIQVEMMLTPTTNEQVLEPGR